MKIRFQADADFNHLILQALKRREPAVDFQTAHAAHLAGRDDPECSPSPRKKTGYW